MSEPKPIRFGAIGCGGMGTVRLQELARHPLGVKIVAAVDINPDRLDNLAKVLGYNDFKRYTGPEDYKKLIDENDLVNAAEIATHLVQAGDCQCIMKGEITTSILMKSILRPSNGIRNGRLISAFSIRELPHYHKLLGFADTGICISPSVNEKCQIIENSIEILQALGVEQPKVAAVCGIETVNPKMKETLDAAELKRMNEEGIITDCIVEGPISYDLAISRHSAEIKGYKSPVAGDTDLILFPDLVSGNLTTKALEYHAEVKGAALVTGAKVPIIFGSRAATADFRYRSVALAAVCSRNI